MGLIITQLPFEILHNILAFVDIEDLAVVPLTCRALHDFIKGNRALCRAVYHNSLDTPPSNSLDWEQELRDVRRLRRVCASDDPEKKSELGFVFNTVTRLLSHAASPDRRRRTPSLTTGRSRNVDLLAALFDSDSNRDVFLSRSFLFERARNETKRFSEPPRQEHQQSAKLHALYGASLLSYGRTRSSRTYPFACSKVYDLRQYTAATGWGPFLADGSGRVDWEKVEAVLLVLRHNMKDKGLDDLPVFSHLWNAPFAGSWPRSYLAQSAAAAAAARPDLEALDPYHVSGTWLRVVCFLDYNDFFSYNFPVSDELPDNVPRPTLDVGEATRLILMKIHVSRVDPADEQGGTGMPVVHFKGFSRALDGSWDDRANSDLRGTARMTPEGEVQWTTWSIFNGHERWRSEGIQLGGIRSARGVVGNWFDKDYDPRGPCGPTAFWKITENRTTSDGLQVLKSDFLPIVDGYGGGGGEALYESESDHDEDYFDDPAAVGTDGEAPELPAESMDAVQY